MARQLYAGDVKPVELKQRIQEAPVAHPERVGAKSETGEATVTRVDDHSDHGGASNDDGDAPVVAVDKTIKQHGIKHHGIETKLKQGFARSEADRSTLARATHTPRWRCRP